MTQNRSELVIFDCDGVLVDSEPISIEVLLALIAEVGGDISEATAYERFLGRSMATINGMLRDEFGLVVTDGHLDGMRATIHERFRSDLKPIPGIAEALGRSAASAASPRRASSNASGCRLKSPACATCSSRIFSAPRWSRAASRRPTSSCMWRARWAWRPKTAR